MGERIRCLCPKGCTTAVFINFLAWKITAVRIVVLYPMSSGSRVYYHYQFKKNNFYIPRNKKVSSLDSNYLLANENTLKYIALMDTQFLRSRNDNKNNYFPVPLMDHLWLRELQA